MLPSISSFERTPIRRCSVVGWAHTWESEGERGKPTLEILDFAALGGSRCQLEGNSIFTGSEHCAEMLAFDETGEGMDEKFSRLDELLEELSWQVGSAPVRSESVMRAMSARRRCHQGHDGYPANWRGM